MKTDESLVKEYINGNEDAFRELTRRYLKPVFHFLARYVGNRTDAEDITQTAFINTWRHIRKFDQTKNFKTWLFAIARHAAIDFLKKKKHFVFSDFEREEGGNPLLETEISAFGTPNQDGSVTAESIQIRPATQHGQ